MAAYIGPSGRCDAVQLPKEVKYPSGNIGKAGDWFVSSGEGKPMLYDPKAFARDFTQVFPRAVDVEADAGIERDWVA